MFLSLSMTFPPLIVVVQSVKQRVISSPGTLQFPLFKLLVLLISYSFDLPLQKLRINYLSENGMFESKTCKQYGR